MQDRVEIVRFMGDFLVILAILIHEVKWVSAFIAVSKLTSETTYISIIQHDPYNLL